LEQWNVGCAVRTLDEVVERVEGLLEQPHLLESMRQQARQHQSPDVSQRIARWLVQALSEQEQDPVYAKGIGKQSSMRSVLAQSRTEACLPSEVQRENL
jgi:hypothetical protein